MESDLPEDLNKGASARSRIRNNEPVQDADGTTKYLIRYSLEGFSGREQETVRYALKKMEEELCFKFEEVRASSGRTSTPVLRFVGRGSRAISNGCFTSLGSGFEIVR